jgi:hypothetical protein
MDHRGLHDLLESINILELRVGIPLRVLVVYPSNFSEVLSLGAISV